MSDNQEQEPNKPAQPRYASPCWNQKSDYQLASRTKETRTAALQGKVGSLSTLM